MSSQQQNKIGKGEKKSGMDEVKEQKLIHTRQDTIKLEQKDKDKIVKHQGYHVVVRQGKFV